MTWRVKLLAVALASVLAVILLPLAIILGFQWESGRHQRHGTGIDARNMRPIVVQQSWQHQSPGMIHWSFQIDSSGAYIPEAHAKTEFIDAVGNVLDSHTIAAPITHETNHIEATKEVYRAAEVDMIRIEILE